LPDPVEFQQKRMATQTWFTFGEKELVYRVRDNSGDRTLEIEYGAISSQPRIVFQRNSWLRNVGLIWCVLGLITLGLDVMGGDLTLGSAFWLFIGLGCLGVYRATWAEYTVFDTNDGAIFVLKDKSHDEITGKIDNERTSHLLAWYRGIEFGRDGEREIQALEWLVKQKAISKAEAEKRMTEIRAEETELLSAPEGDHGARKLH